MVGTVCSSGGRTRGYQGSGAWKAPERRRGDCTHAGWRWMGHRHLQGDDPDGGKRRNGTDSSMRGEKEMDNQIPKYVTQSRAAYLLGLSVTEIARNSQKTGIGQFDRAGQIEERFFTYEELHRICGLS